MPYEPIIPEGLRLGLSRVVEGAVTGHLFDKNNDLVGLASWRWVEEGASKPSGVKAPVIWAAAGIAVGVVATVVAVRNAPRIKTWWNDSALPAMRSKWNHITKTVEEGPALAAVMAISSDTATADFSREVDAAFADPRISMSSAEALERRVAVLAAAAFIARQMRTLANSRIVEDDDGFADLKQAFDKLTTQQVTDSINVMLETNASVLDEETSTELLKIFGGGRFIAGQYVPVENERVKEALCLTGGAV
jgi:hypothetical protein